MAQLFDLMGAGIPIGGDHDRADVIGAVLARKTIVTGSFCQPRAGAWVSRA
jgi:hypothetical protein